MQRDYAPKGVRFFYVYKALAHPEHNGYVQPFTFEERLMHVKEAERTLGSKFSWICDTMQNDLKHNLGNAPNSEFIIDPEGKVVRKRSWSDPAKVRKDLEELVGPVDNPTKVEDLNLKTNPPPKAAAKGVVKRLKLTGSFKPLRIEPVVKEKGQPFYAKLRAEADTNLQRTGKGKLYLAFHMDPIYHVHWNNLAKPIRVKLDPDPGITLSDQFLEGPKPREPADIDPREFLIDIDAADAKKGSIRLSVSYFACNDEQGWCKPVSQEYVVSLKVDPDAGWVQRRSSRRGNRKSAGRSGRPPFGNGPPTIGRITKIDLDKRTITLHNRQGDQTNYKVATDARLMRQQKRGKLNDFKTGDFVMLRIEKSKTGPANITGMMQREGPGRPTKGKTR